MVNPLKCSPSSFQEENAYVYQNVIIRYIGCLIRIQLGNILGPFIYYSQKDFVINIQILAS